MLGSRLHVGVLPQQGTFSLGRHLGFSWTPAVRGDDPNSHTCGFGRSRQVTLDRMAMSCSVPVLAVVHLGIPGPPGPPSATL